MRKCSVDAAISTVGKCRTRRCVVSIVVNRSDDVNKRDFEGVET